MQVAERSRHFILQSSDQSPAESSVAVFRLHKQGSTGFNKRQHREHAETSAAGTAAPRSARLSQASAKQEKCNTHLVTSTSSQTSQ